ncbi:MAG: PTS lactose/cellobiose transporter subunit IIA [Peptostreptococcaceae bacterium]
MDEKIFEISFTIIGYAGESRSIAFEALSEAKKGNIEKAREMIVEAKAVMNQAHRCQTELIQKEASGEGNQMSVILVHAQDHLMTTMTYQQLVEEFIDLYERIK